MQRISMYYAHRTEGRERLRLAEYDYHSSAYYYVTLCIQNRECLFGEINNGEMILNVAGIMIQGVWLDIPNKYDGLEIDSFVVMPNHLHGILIINERGPARGPAPTLSLPNIMRNFKSFTTNRYIRGIEENKFKPFEKRLWQRSYYEHIIRKNESLNKIRQYIIDNPKSWEKDRENPKQM